MKRATLEIDTEGAIDVNTMELCEARGYENRITGYKVEGFVESDWKLLAEGTKVGGRKIDRFPKVTVWKVRLTVLADSEHPAISKFGLYLSL